MDEAHLWTDEKIEELEKRLADIYRRAEKSIGESWKKYMDEIGKRLDADQKAYEAAKAAGDKDLIKKAGITLSRTKKELTITNAHYKELTATTAKEISRVNETAAAYVNGQLPEVYARNYNSVVSGINKRLRGYSFEMVDASTVRNLALSDKTLLPYKIIDGVKDVRWNVQKVNSEVLQGILTGESMPNIAKRLTNVLGMNETSAIRNARTSVTSAENKGRIDMIHEAEDKGVQTKKVWIATKDNRTRDAHLDLDGEEAFVDEPFYNEFGKIMFPGDPDADPSNTYNCRCSLGYKVVGFWNRR